MILRATVLLGAALLAGSQAAAAVPAPSVGAERLVIVDNDFAAAGGAMAVMPLIAAPDIRVLGLTTVIGDSYVNDAVAHTLRFLEIIHRGDIPVVPGANAPLVRTKVELNAWERLYGTMPYKGAWNEPAAGVAPLGPEDISAMTEGATRLSPSTQRAADFLIDQVNAHPGQVSILAAGPLTNLALAIRLDPGFAAKVREVVIMGGLVDTNQRQVSGSANFNTDFNFLFDPEAAAITLAAPFPRIVIVGAVANETNLDKQLVARVAAVKTPLTDYYARNAWLGLPLWDELAAAVLADPRLITASTKAYMSVNIDHGMDYGRAHVWPEATRPHLGERQVQIVDRVDLGRFYDDFVRALQAPLR